MPNHHPSDSLAISMAGTILLGIAANLGLLAAALVLDVGRAVFFALASLGLAYVCQALSTAAAVTGRYHLATIAIALQWIAAACWAFGALTLL